MSIREQFRGSSFQITLWKCTIEMSRFYFNILFIIALRLQDEEVNYCIPNPSMELQKLQGIADNRQAEAASCLMQYIAWSPAWPLVCQVVT